MDEQRRSDSIIGFQDGSTTFNVNTYDSHKSTYKARHDVLAEIRRIPGVVLYFHKRMEFLVYPATKRAICTKSVALTSYTRRRRKKAKNSNDIDNVCCTVSSASVAIRKFFADHPEYELAISAGTWLMNV